MRPVMQATQLWKIYASGDSTVQAVRGVDVSIMEGEMIAIMGPLVVERQHFSMYCQELTNLTPERY